MRIGKYKVGPGGVILIALIPLALVYLSLKQFGFDLKEKLLGAVPGVVNTTEGGANTVRIKGSSTINDNVAKDWSQEFMRNHADARILVESSGSGPGIAALLKGEVEIAASSRPANEKEQEQAKAKNVDLTAPESEHIVGFDAIAVAVNAANPVNQMTVPQLRAVFSGNVTNWSQVGGSGGPINVIVRPKELGAYEVFSDSILGKEGKFLSGAETIKTNKDLADRIRNDKNAISFIAFNDVGSNKALKIAAAEGTAATAPSADAIRSRSYLLTRKLYLYTMGPTAGLTKEFLEFALGNGQEQVAAAGFVDMRLKLVEGSATPGTPGKTSGSKRRKFNTDLRFKSGSFDLDNLALADLEIIGRTLCNSAQMNTLVEFVGYADSMGSPEQNKGLSLQRADKVKALFSKQCPKLSVQTSGLGAAAPIGDNSTEEGRQLNRRVEIWVTEL